MVFAILTLVQLLVVAKGAERVAEVAARFTLDALPGKQMSIDADLRAGLLDAAEARRRRRALERESQLYGAMDGALKFVKGDAVAGVAIVLVNVVGGLVAGLVRGLSAAEAGRRYSLLAVGDGISSQIASLLVAVAAGVAVTRVSAEDGPAGLSGEVRRQLLAEPGALAAVAALLLALALAPGLPAFPFLAVAALLAAAPSRRRGGAASGFPSAAGEEAWARARGPVRAAVAGDRRARRRPAAAGAPTRPRARRHRLRCARTCGIRWECGYPRWRSGPPAGRQDSATGSPSTTSPSTTDGSRSTRLLVLAPPDDLELVGIPSRAAADPISGRPSALVGRVDAGRAAALGRVCEPPERLLAEVTGALRRHAHHLIGVQDVQCLLDDLEPVAPALVREVTRQLPSYVLAEVLRRLVEEGVSIRPLRVILESILQAGAAGGAAPLTEACRRALRRQLGHAHAAGGPLSVLLLEPAAEQAIREALAGEMLALEPRRALALLDALAAELGGHPSTPVVLVSPDVRRAVRSLFAPRFPRLPVLAYEELPPELRSGRWDESARRGERRERRGGG